MHQIDRGLMKGIVKLKWWKLSLNLLALVWAFETSWKYKVIWHSHSCLKTNLKGHFKEDSSTDLYYKLVNVTQVGSYLRTFSLELLKQYLDDQGLTDDLLSRWTKLPVWNLKGNQGKGKTQVVKCQKLMSFRQPSKWVSQVRVRQQLKLGFWKSQQGAEGDKPKNHTFPSVPSSHNSELYETVKLLREEIAELRKSVNTSQRITCQGKVSTKRSCKVDQDQETGDDCEHCYKCGQSGHFSRGCRDQRRSARKLDGMDVQI